MGRRRAACRSESVPFSITGTLGARASVCFLPTHSRLPLPPPPPPHRRASARPAARISVYRTEMPPSRTTGIPPSLPLLSNAARGGEKPAALSPPARTVRLQEEGGNLDTPSQFPQTWLAPQAFFFLVGVLRCGRICA